MSQVENMTSLDGWSWKAIPTLLWRRRILFVSSLVAMLPISLLAAFILPRTYVARSLVRWEEPAATNPLFRDANYRMPERMLDRIGGFRALLGSEHVIGKVLEQFGEIDQEGTTQRALKIQGLRDALALDLIGNDFLEFRLSGRSPDGLGMRLDAIMSQFFEGLVPEGPLTAQEIVLSNRKKTLDGAERTYADLSERISNLLPGGLAAGFKQQSDLQILLEQRSRDLVDVNLKLDELWAESRASVNNNGEPETVGKTAGLRGGSGMTDVLLDLPEARFVKLQQLMEARAVLRTNIDELNSSLRDVGYSIDEYKRLESQLTSAQAAVTAAKRAYEASKAGVGNSGENSGTRMANSPRLFIIDRPKDPLFPTVSRRAIFMVGMFGNFVLSLGIAIAFEAFKRARLAS
jgi:uncharacterized protein involved in exopolysaccharide biosynthesis